MVGVSPWQKRPVVLDAASCASRAPRPCCTQWRYQAFLASSSTPSVCFRYFSTRRLFSGWVSQAMPNARSRTRARPSASAGSSGGSGCVSSRYSMMARDWPMTASPSTSVGTSAVGFTLRYSGVSCWPPSLSMCTGRYS